MVEYRGPWCCRLCGETRAHGPKILSHLAEEHPEIIDRRLAALAANADALRVVEISTEANEPGGEPVKSPR